MNSSPDLDLLFVRYFSGSLSREDRRQLDGWLAEAPGRAEELARLQELWRRTEAEPMQVDATEALAKFKARARREETRAPARPALMIPGRVRSWLQVAAVLAIVVGGSAVAYFAPRTSPSVDSRYSALSTFSTPRGQRARLNLPDGTRVLLAPNSSLQVSRSFGTTARDVQLSGLAFFEVAKDSARPFRVRGGGGTAQVLGTKFSMRADGTGKTRVEVVVSEGRVAVADQILTRGDVGRLWADGSMHVARSVDVASRLGWIDGRLAFDRAPLPVVLRELEEWFDVDFVVTDSALQRSHLTTTLRNDSLIEMLRLLETAIGAKAEVSGKTVTLRLVRNARQT